MFARWNLPIAKHIIKKAKNLGPFKTILEVEKVGPKRYEAVIEDVIKAVKKGKAGKKK